MKRIYKFVVRPEIGPERVLALECNVVSHLEKPSEVFDGKLSFLKDRSIRIWDYYPSIDPELSSDDWQCFFEIVSLTPVGQVKPIQDYEVYVYKLEVEGLLQNLQETRYFWLLFLLYGIYIFEYYKRVRETNTKT